MCPSCCSLVRMLGYVQHWIILSSIQDWLLKRQIINCELCLDWLDYCLQYCAVVIELWGKCAFNLLPLETSCWMNSVLRDYLELDVLDYFILYWMPSFWGPFIAPWAEFLQVHLFQMRKHKDGVTQSSSGRTGFTCFFWSDKRYPVGWDDPAFSSWT